VARDLEFIQRGKVLIVRRQFQEAVRVCRLGLLVNPTLVEGRLVLGMALMALGRYDDVLAEMRIALQVDADNALATLLRGEALFYKGDHDQAQQSLERARALDPQNDKPEKLLREIALAREAGLAPDPGRDGTDTKVYPAVAEVRAAPPAARSYDLPEAIPPPRPGSGRLAAVGRGEPLVSPPVMPVQADSSSVFIGSAEIEYLDDRTEVDAPPAGMVLGADALPAEDPAPERSLPMPDPAEEAAFLNGPPTPSDTPAESEEENPESFDDDEDAATMPWVGSDDEEEEPSTATHLAETTPVQSIPFIPPAARRTPRPAAGGGPPVVVARGATSDRRTGTLVVVSRDPERVAPPVGRRSSEPAAAAITVAAPVASPAPPPPAGVTGVTPDGFQETGDGDDYQDAEPLPQLPGDLDQSVSSGSTTREHIARPVFRDAGTDGEGGAPELHPRRFGSGTGGFGERSDPGGLGEDESTAPTRPESPLAVSLAAPPSPPVRLAPSPSPALLPSRTLGSQAEADEFDEDKSTQSRSPDGLSFGAPPAAAVPVAAPAGPDMLARRTMQMEASNAPAMRPGVRPPSAAQPAVVPQPFGRQPTPTGSDRARAAEAAPSPRRDSGEGVRPVAFPWRIGVAAVIVLAASIALGFGIRGWRGRAEASRMREQAQRQLAFGNLPGYLAAERIYDQVVTAYPDDTEALAGLALVRAAIPFEFDDADRDARGALLAARRPASVPPRAAAMIDAASVYVRLSSGDAEAAERIARDAASKRYLEDPLLAYLVGRAQLLRGDGRAAVDSFQTSLKRDSHYVLALSGLGLAQVSLGSNEAAMVAYNRALLENANHVATLVARSWLRIHLARDLLEAETDLVAVVDKLRQQSSRAQIAKAELALANLYARKGDVARARAALEEARRAGPPRSAEFWEQTARAALSVYDVPGARRDAERAIELAPASPGPHLALAGALVEQGDAGGAVSEILTAQAPDTADVLALRARARLMQGRTEVARQDIDAAAARSPDLPDVALVRARLDLVEGANGRALEALRRLAERLPGRADICEGLGLALAARGDAGARSWLERAVGLDPYAVQARVELARLLRREGRYNDAVARLEEALKLRPDRTVERELAELRYEIGDLVGAQRSLDAVMAGEGGADPEVLALAMRVAASSGDVEATERLLDKAAQRGVARLRLLHARAEAALVAGRFREAAATARQVIALAAGDAEARATWALAMAALGRGKQARDYLRQSLRRLGPRPELLTAQATLDVRDDQPDLRLLDRAVKTVQSARRPPRLVSDAYTLLGSAYYSLGEVGHAGAAFDEALRFNPKSARANYFHGILLSERDQTDEARRAFQVAADSRPRLPQAFYELGKLLQKSGDQDSAKNAYGEYLRLAPEGDYAEDVRRELAQLHPKQ
jgi:tetratricopeptide (TPR) repeat protein